MTNQNEIDNKEDLKKGRKMEGKEGKAKNKMCEGVDRK